jgi:hypothetical protein
MRRRHPPGDGHSGSSYTHTIICVSPGTSRRLRHRPGANPAFEPGPRIFGQLAWPSRNRCVRDLRHHHDRAHAARFRPVSRSSSTRRWSRRKDRHGARHHPAAAHVGQVRVDMGRVAAELLFLRIDRNLNPRRSATWSSTPCCHPPVHRSPTGREPQRPAIIGLGMGSCCGVTAPTGPAHAVVRTRDGHSRPARSCRNVAPETPADRGTAPTHAASMTRPAVAATAQKAPQTPQRL